MEEDQHVAEHSGGEMYFYDDVGSDEQLILEDEQEPRTVIVIRDDPIDIGTPSKRQRKLARRSSIQTRRQSGTGSLFQEETEWLMFHKGARLRLADFEEAKVDARGWIAPSSAQPYVKRKDSHATIDSWLQKLKSQNKLETLTLHEMLQQIEVQYDFQSPWIPLQQAMQDQPVTETLQKGSPSPKKKPTPKTADDFKKEIESTTLEIATVKDSKRQIKVKIEDLRKELEAQEKLLKFTKTKETRLKSKKLSLSQSLDKALEQQQNIETAVGL